MWAEFPFNVKSFRSMINRHQMMKYTENNELQFAMH